MSQSGIKVLVVDDSPVIRRVLTGILEADPDIAEVHTAPGGNLAMRKIEKLNPDVVTLDVEMPDLDGIQTLKRIMDESPRSVIMVSALTTQGADKTIEALEIGALDVLAKPSGRLSKDISEIGEDLLRKVKAVAHLRFRRRDSKASEAKLSKSLSPVDVFKGSLPYQIVAIGASTGGTDAIRKLLSCLPADYPAGLVIAQHMPEGFTASFAARLNELSAVEVKEASHRDMVLPGRVLLAPGHSHMRVHRDEFGTWVELRKDAKVNGHRPSVDVLFDSVAESFGKDVAAILLTGMGRDGA
ncbi:chemotaxis response regulator protein-glutamate methylesterase, partial [Myxococcota bacterium]|nr:chemotaxis response regulator protein-glutamate methylesterase [Myxococcota bacterium]